MTEPKTPEERLKVAMAAAKAGHAECFCETTECHIDRLAALAVLVGRIQQTYYDCGNCGWADTSERDRLLAELEKGERG